MRRAPVLLTLLTCFFACLSIAPNALGHGEEPISQRIYSLGEGWLLKSNFGFTSSEFEGFVCEEAFLGGGKFTVIPLDADRWITLGESAIHITDDGCSFTRVRDLARAPADADGSGQNAIYLSNEVDTEGMWLSRDAGETWQRIDFDVTDTQLTGVRFDGPDRAFVSAYDRASSGAAIMLEVSLEAAPTVSPITIPEGLKYPYVLDAKAGELVWLARDEGQTIFWGSVDTPTRDSLPIMTWPAGAVLAEDTQTVWLAGLEMGKGVTIGTRGAEETIWETVAVETTASCVGRIDGETYVCSMRRFDDADLMKLNGNGTLEALTDFRDLEGARTDCSPESNVGDVCPLVWVEVEKALRVGADAGATPDTGTPDVDMGKETADMGEEALDGPSPRSDSGSNSGCASAGSDDVAPITTLIFIALLALRRRL